MVDPQATAKPNIFGISRKAAGKKNSAGWKTARKKVVVAAVIFECEQGIPIILVKFGISFCMTIIKFVS